MESCFMRIGFVFGELKTSSLLLQAFVCFSVESTITLKNFETVELSQINSVASLFRFDTKFLFSEHKLSELLELLKNNFSILQIANEVQHPYHTLYFDTPEFKLYLDHHNGKPNRMKVRVRHYQTSGDVFFEVKHKLKGLQTGKLRLPRQKLMFELTADEWNAIKTHDKNIKGLEQKLITNFERITLVNKQADERITIDTNLSFNNFREKKMLHGVCLAEVKHTAPQISNEVRNALKQINARETSFSKYAIGIAMLENKVKSNLFKPTILQLQKLTDGLS